jgi:histidinol-phosphate aminotransferase
VSPDLLQLARPEIRSLQPYSHASWDPTLERLHANENPWRFSGDTTQSGLNRYPEPHPLAVEHALAALYGVTPTQVLAGRGSDEAIDLLVRGFCAAGRDAVMIFPPTFGMYGVAARVQGADVVEVPLRADDGYALDERAILARWQPNVKLLFFCSPNNPTGNCVDEAVILRIASALANRALVVVDEAYIEFAGRPGFTSRLATVPNLVVLRTLSKAYALAGARCGAALADPAIIELLRRMIPPYSLPTPTIEAVLLALDPTRRPVALQRIEQLLAERARLVTAVARSPLIRRVWPTDANFVLVEAVAAARVMQAGRDAGLLLRDFSGGALTANCVRITVGTPAQNDRLLAHLEVA